METSRGKLHAPEFDQTFRERLHREIEEADLLLSSLLNYFRLTAPIQRKETIRKLCEEAIHRHRFSLAKKDIQVETGFEADLPEAAVPVEPLRYVLNSLLIYALGSVSPKGRMGVVTRSFASRDAESDPSIARWPARWIEILLSFLDGKERTIPPRSLSPGPPLRREAWVADPILRLAEDILKKNDGEMNLRLEGDGAKRVIALRLPAERREVVDYPKLVD